MDDVSELSFRKHKTAYVSGVESHRRITSQVRALLGECLRVAREDRHLSAQAEMTIHVAKALHQPAAEEACAASKEKALPAQFVPQWSRMGQNEFQIPAINLVCGHC
jgi:hypothetical protein